MVSTLPPLPFSKKIRWALIHTMLKFTLVYASILFLSCWAWKLCIVWSPSIPGTHSDFYLNRTGSSSSSVPVLFSISQGICTRCSSSCKPLHSSCLFKPISSFRYKIFQHFSRNTYPSSLWFGKIPHFMAPLAGDAVLFHQGYSFTNRRLFLSTLWDFWQLMAPSCVPLQALSSPKRQCPTPENIPHSWRQPTSSEGSAEGRRLLPWLPSLSLGHPQKIFLAPVLLIT